MVYQELLESNPFHHNEILNFDFTSFTSWYKCINETKFLNIFMGRARELFYHASAEEDAYLECMNH